MLLYRAFLICFLLSLQVAANDELLKLQSDDNQWALPSKNYAGHRYSKLNQINKRNVKNLQVAWTFSTGVLRGHEGTPLVIGDTMYFASPFPNNVFALDLSKEGAPLKWKYAPKQDPSVPAVACCDTVNRGLAYAEGKIFLTQLDTHLVALDAKTGKELWKVKQGDYKKAETITAAPLVVKNLVISGISGGEFGVRGFITANDINTGKQVWRKYSVGPDNEIGFTGSISTWSNDQWKVGGGTTWGYVTYDPKIDLLYYGTSNPGVWNPDLRPGDNKWACSIFARKPSDGIAQWAYQKTPHDGWDYDGINENLLIDTKYKGKERNLLVTFDRNGFTYVMDRKSGELLAADKFTNVNWASHIDLKSGRPKVNADKMTSGTRNTKGICPSAMGGKNNQPAAYSPKNKTIYVPINNLCMDYEGVEIKYQAGQPYVGAIVKSFAGPDKAGGKMPGNYKGAFIAWDLEKGARKWTINEKLAAWSGALVTESDIVFYGTMDGWFKAIDAHSGKVLWKFKAPSGIIGNPMTYIGPDGKQYVAVLSGVGGWAGVGLAAGLDNNDPTAGLGAQGAFANLDQITQLGGTLLVFTLPKTK